MSVELDLSFFDKRGIPEVIWRSRPYLWWTPDCPDAAKAPFADLSPTQRAFVTKILNQSPGWVITRHPPPMDPPLERIYPELRPLRPVKTQGPTVHWHGDNLPEGELPEWARMPGTKTTWKPHIDRNKADDDHRGVNRDDLHRHQPYAKYVFPTSASTDEWYPHDHANSSKRIAAARRDAIRLAHLAKAHGGVERDGMHWHSKRVKSHSNLARRIDVHPTAAPLLARASAVFFVIEGCIKADAVLADGGAVFSVPSVSLWEAEELAPFVTDHLNGKVVVIVPDADWASNDKVINQARMCQTVLHRLGVEEIHVAAPPVTFRGEETKGVDDFIGAGGHLEDLRVIDAEPPGGLHEFVSRTSFRRDRVRRDVSVLRALSTYTGPSGTFKAPLRTLARVIGTNDMAVSRAVRDLELMGAAVVDGDLAVETDWFSRRLQWRERPAITLIPELRSVDRPEHRLADVIRLPLRVHKGGIQHAG